MITKEREFITHDIRYCESCGESIQKKKYQSWKIYNSRKYCSEPGCYLGKDNKFNPDSVDELPVAHYIGKNSRNGRLMADFNLGVLKAVEKISNDKVKNSEDGNNGKGVICTFKGIPVTPDMVKTANQWLMDNWIGKASQRNPEPEKDDRTEFQKLEELKYTMKELGFGMYELDKYEVVERRVEDVKGD